jgi:hypothetical protein
LADATGFTTQALWIRTRSGVNRPGKAGHVLQGDACGTDGHAAGDDHGSIDIHIQFAAVTGREVGTTRFSARLWIHHDEAGETGRLQVDVRLPDGGGDSRLIVEANAGERKLRAVATDKADSFCGARFGRAASGDRRG